MFIVLKKIVWGNLALAKMPVVLRAMEKSDILSNN